MAQQKIFILDTNVLVYDPDALFTFDEGVVGIPGVVLEELDHLKRESSDRGRNAREAIRHLDELRNKGSLGQGVQINGILIKVLFLPQDFLPQIPFNIRIEDNAILLTALSLIEEGNEVLFISKDLNARVKADALGIQAQDYVKEFITEEKFYKGWTNIQVPSVQLKKEMPIELEILADSQILTMNEFVIVESRHNPFNYRVFRYLGGKNFKLVREPAFKWPLQPRNPHQSMALDLLLDKDIQLISMFGPAGTGKTFLALLAGLHQVLVEDEYEKILISRPVVPLGRDIGFLPGDIQEKLYNWMLPIYDNMEYILHAVNVAQHLEDVDQEYRGAHKKKGKKKYYKRDVSDLAPLDELVGRGKISMEAITYMRGRSIPYQFIMIDEVQNLTPHEVKTLVSRVGEGSKIVLMGDPYQIDSPYLDFSSNGLVITSEKFRGQRLFGTIFLETSERSELSKLAGELL